MKKTLLALGLVLAFSSTAQAAVVTYADHASFLAAVSNAKTDNFAGNFQILSNAAMKASSNGSIGYASTGFNNLNILTGAGALCWGCNGSGVMDLTSTNVGTSNGVYGFSMDVQGNTGYNAYLTFGDNSTYALLNPKGYFGFTSNSLIKHVQIAQVFGQTSTSGSIWFDQVTVAAANDVPEPGSLAILALGLLGLAGARRRAARK